MFVLLCWLCQSVLFITWLAGFLCPWIFPGVLGGDCRAEDLFNALASHWQVASYRDSPPGNFVLCVWCVCVGNRFGYCPLTHGARQFLSWILRGADYWSGVAISLLRIVLKHAACRTTLLNPFGVGEDMYPWHSDNMAKQIQYWKNHLIQKNKMFENSRKMRWMNQ